MIGVPGLSVSEPLHRFVAQELLPGTDISEERFWSLFGDIVVRFGPRNQELLDLRASLQREIDAWHRDRLGKPHDVAEYRELLERTGYLVPPGPDFLVSTEGVDPEVATLAGPQLVVPLDNPRYVINAANARWGSLYDALYGTDALGERPARSGYDPERGNVVIAWVRSFLDEAVPLEAGSHADAARYAVVEDALRVELRDGSSTTLADPSQFVGFTGGPTEPTTIGLVNHGLGIELKIDRQHPVGVTDPAGVCDVEIESAPTVIMDCEDSVAAVDAVDKVRVYRNWLGLLKGDLTAQVTKDGRTFTRQLARDRAYIAPDGTPRSRRGRALLLVRHVGQLMTTPAVLDRDGNEVFEFILDAVVTVVAALHDAPFRSTYRNSRSNSIYVVKPKLHGPDEAAYIDALFSHLEASLDLDPHAIKVGLMDEERRTTLNLAECIRALRYRIVFINTGFLDRTGDEIHTSREAGPMVRKLEMREQQWFRAYEDWNVDVGLRSGMSGRGQIGKGMWTAVDRMAAMLEEKVAQPLAGASCAWVPSPTAATLHATHYHRVDVFSQQEEIARRTRTTLDELLVIPVVDVPAWSDAERRAEIENDIQGILGYVVRWVDQGVGCSKVPDLEGVELMEDRATCRISSQLVANWLHHGVVSRDDVMAALRRMATIVDEQNASDPAYVPMGPSFEGPAFAAACDLVLGGHGLPCGYTEPVLHARRLEVKRGRT